MMIIDKDMGTKIVVDRGSDSGTSPTIYDFSINPRMTVGGKDEDIHFVDVGATKKKGLSKTEIAREKRRKLSMKFSDVENSYYFQMHSFFSIPELKDLLTENDIDPNKYKFDYSRASESKNYVTIWQKGTELSLNQVFADKFDEFTKICTEKHFPIYTDVVEDKFSFNFTAEEMTAWLTTYPKTIFRNFEYNRATHAIEPKVKNAEHFDVERTVKSKIENLFESNINVQEKVFKVTKPKLDEALKVFSENFEMQQSGISLKHNNGWLDDVLIRGGDYLKNHDGSDTTDYWLASLQSIFSITPDDFFSLVSFVINSLRVRLFGDSKAMRVLIITGDSGVGKDSFLQGLLTGLNYRDADKYILRGALKGATGFAVAGEKNMKAIMYNYISDDLSSANNSTSLDTITSPRLPLEIKGNTQKYIPKRFNSVITNNSTHVLFGKEKDHNAIARRTDFLSIKYASGCNSNDYRKFYTFYDGKLDGYWSGFFAFCFELEKQNDKADSLSDLAREYTLSNLHNLFYKANDDNRVIDFITTLYENALVEPDPLMIDKRNELIKEINTKDGKKTYFIIKSTAKFFDRDFKFSGDTIKKTVSAHIAGALINHKYRDGYITVNAAIMIPVDFFATQSDDLFVIDQIPEDVEGKENIIKNFEKYI